MVQSNRVVAVTGAAGYIGSRLLHELEERGNHRKLVAFDSKPLAFPIHNIAAYRKDVASSIDDTLSHHRTTTLVHLAFDAHRGRNRREVASIREQNLDTLKSVLDSCVRARS